VIQSIKPKMQFRFTAVAIATLALLAPALWNGFPLLQYDTGGYLARWYEGHLEESRSTVYGLYLLLTARPDFWPAVAGQALLTVWVLWLTLRAHAIATPLALVATATALSILTSLSWVASTLLTDVFTGLSVLALYLVTLRAETLARWERGALIALIAFAAATHTATLAVLLALLAAGLLIALVWRGAVPFTGLVRGASAVTLSVALLLAANVIVAGKLAWTPGGSAIPFGRMLQSGIVAHYLADHCPDARLPKLCANRDKLPTDTDFFFWGSDLFDQLGRFEGLGEEMRIVVRESLTEYPAMQIKSAIAATAKQLVRVATGYGVHTEIWHTTWIIEQYVPAAVPAMKAARQQQGNLDFAMINRLHVPIAWASMLLLIGVLALSRRRPQFQNVRELAAIVTLAILANAVVCGALANPHDRYGARIVWLATLVLWIVAWQTISTARSDRARIK
jgi:MFS family permease